MIELVITIKTPLSIMRGEQNIKNNKKKYRILHRTTHITVLRNI
jgi:hypothetical protein